MDPHTYCHDAYTPYNSAPRNSDLFGYINLALNMFNLGLFINRSKAQKKQIEEQQKQIDDLTTAVNESREQIQALLDYCFTDRSKWKEGASRSIRDGTGRAPSVNEEGASSISRSNGIGCTPDDTRETSDQILQRSLDELIVSLDMKDPSIN